MTFIYADKISIVSFSVFSLIMAVTIIFAIRQSKSWKLWVSLYFCLVFLFSTAALTGVVEKWFVPFGPVLFSALIFFSLALSFSKTGLEIASAFAFTTLTAFQGFRVPLEIILHKWAEMGTIPSTMTWTGQNFDIISGLIACLAAPFVEMSRKIALAANLIGFVLLMNVIRVVLMSSPLPS